MFAKSILDTDILSEYLKGHNSAVVQNAAGYAHEHGVFTFTSVAVFEIVYGLEVKSAHSQLLKVRAWMDRNDTITPLAEDYVSAAKHSGQCTKARLNPGVARLSDRCRSQCGLAGRW